MHTYTYTHAHTGVHICVHHIAGNAFLVHQGLGNWASPGSGTLLNRPSRRNCPWCYIPTATYFKTLTFDDQNSWIFSSWPQWAAVFRNLCIAVSRPRCRNDLVKEGRSWLRGGEGEPLSSQKATGGSYKPWEVAKNPVRSEKVREVK